MKKDPTKLASGRLRRLSVNRVHATLAIALLIAVMLITQAVNKSSDLQCYAIQQASKHRLVYDQGFATPDEIREIVWNHTLAGFDGQVWRATLDGIVHAIFMGGERGEQVVAQLQNPSDQYPIDQSSDVHCFGYIGWIIRDNRDETTFERFGGFDGSSGLDIEAVHQVTTALQAVPPEELRHYTIEAIDVSGKYSKREPNWTYYDLDAGEVSADAWLRGETVPNYSSGWYAAWQELQKTDDE